MIKSVLLLGDCSGVHKNLCEGLRNINIEAVDASYGNAWRKLGSSINFAQNILGLPAKISENISPFLNLPRLMNYDIVQFIQYNNNFNPRFGINNFLTKVLLSTNKKAFLITTGCDSYFRKYCTSGTYEFSEICSACLKYDRGSNACSLDNDLEEIELVKMLQNVKGVIPSAYEYAQSHRLAGSSKLLNTIPIPVNVDKVKYSENTIGNKLVVFHGINRIGFKGTELIRLALENVQKKFPNDIEVIIDGKMSLDDYLRILSRTNVVVDQTYGLSYGMNAVYSMALGKVVVGGGHPKGLAEYGVSSSPIIPVLPNLQSIEESVERLIECRKDIPAMGFESRKYVEEVHHYELIAKKFLATWESA
jgi:glycosyltransferase involved in cell wall biosynthesis